MLRVGLTGGLGSGKSTVARMFAERGARVLESDAIGRELMEPGEPVYRAIVERFGPEVVQAEGRLDRAALARLAFTQGRVEELNEIVHPAVIARQERLLEEIATRDAEAIVVVESALIFETKYGGAEGWRLRFDRMVLVTAPEDIRMARFVQRSSNGGDVTEAQRKTLEAEARRRIKHQMPDEQKAALSNYVLHNDQGWTELQWQVDQLWPMLESDARASRLR